MESSRRESLFRIGAVAPEASRIFLQGVEGCLASRGNRTCGGMFAHRIFDEMVQGRSSQTGSVALASPVKRKAWQRHPPKSSLRRSQERQGSGIQASPRNF
jgi:hypothetical protein